MRVKKAKFIRKYLRFYKIVFGINPPYDVILDGNFVFAALKFKIDIFERIKALLQEHDIRFYTLRSAYTELNKAGEKTRESMEFVKDHCTILEDGHCSGHTAAEKLISFLELNASDTEKKFKKSFFVASQDKDLRVSLNRMAGIPTIYLSKVVMVMEPPSDISKSFNQVLEADKVALSAAEVRALEIVQKKKSKTEAGEGSASAAVEVVAPVHTERRKRKAQDANPLSKLQREEDSKRSKKLKAAKFTRR